MRFGFYNLNPSLDMEAVSAVASTTQLISYCISVGTVLRQIIKDIKEGPSAFRDQERNVNHILNIIHQISQHHRSSPEVTNEAIPIIIEIADLAHKIQTLLENTGTWYTRAIYSSARSTALEGLFDALTAKAQVLHLYISHGSYHMLFAIDHKLKDIKADQMGGVFSKGAQSPKPTSSEEEPMVCGLIILPTYCFD